ncbi:MAG: hypothetical protein INR72_20575 [Williamsia herbipolensis]|nr:hypothetical protein [Williamsia herbipolensis]
MSRRNTPVRTLTSMVAAALCVAAFVVLDPSAADAAPASSSKTLPALVSPASALDTASGSIVVGPPQDNFRSIALYHRSPGGHWGSRMSVPGVSRGSDTIGVVDVQAIGGTKGFFLIAWLYMDDQERGSVWSSTLLPSGRFTGPKHLFDTRSSVPITMAGNTTGDAAVTQFGPVSAYTRGVGWRRLAAAPAQPGRHAPAALTVSAARSVDVTEVYTDNGRDRIVQHTWTSGATTSTSRRIYTAPDGAPTDFAIAMDGNGLQTLVASDADDAIKVYRESRRRGAFEYRWRKPSGDVSQPSTPRVASAGNATRVTWRTPDSGTSVHTRLLRGSTWGATSSTDAAPSGNDPANVRIANPLGIGTSGRGVEIGVRELAGGKRELDRGLLELTRRSDQVLTSALSTSRPALDVNPSGVSQTVSTRYVTVNGHRVLRTIALVRR